MVFFRLLFSIFIQIYSRHTTEMKSIFIGNKTKPTFLAEIIPNKKQIRIYKPDRFSKNEEFYEKYALGQEVLSATYSSLLFTKAPIAYKQFLYVPEMIIVVKKKQIRVSTTIRI